MRSLRTIALIATLCSTAAALADQLMAYPPVGLADGRSTTTITAEIRDSSGRAVPDGTRVVFVATLGSFRDSIVATSGGIARAILVSGSTPGVSKITATPLAGGAGPSTFEFEFVGDRALLSSAREYIELVAPGMMSYAVDSQIIAAAADQKPGSTAKQVSLRYRDISIDADDIQIRIPSYEVRARKAHLKMGKLVKTFDELYLRLNMRAGYGTTTFTAPPPQFIAVQGRWLGMARESSDGSLDFSIPPAQERYGLVQIKGPAIIPSRTTAPSTYFEFQELSGSPSRIAAKKAVIFPGRQIQFQKADIYVADNRIMRLPLFQVNLLQASNSPIITESLVNVSDNQVLVNYPYFLQLKPGESTLLRFRTGDLYGRSLSTSSGAFLDLEHTWNRGDDMDGSVALRGIGRSDWRVDLQQYMRFDSRTTASAQVGIPANTGLFGSTNLSHQFNGFQTNLSGDATQTFRGISSSSRNILLTTETDPRKIAHTPFQLSYGLTANESTNSFLNGTQRGAGLTSRLQSSAIKVDPSSTLTTSLTASKLAGQDVAPGLSILETTSLSKKFSNQFSTVFTYDFTHDGFNDKVLGQHRISAWSNFNAGNFGLRLFGSRSLDIDRASLFGDMDYKLGPLWRLAGAYTFDKYLATTFLDYTIAINYHVGWREIGLIWSKQTNRLGIQFLGATVN